MLSILCPNTDDLPRRQLPTRAMVFDLGWAQNRA
jgi:hypothetical protein